MVLGNNGSAVNVYGMVNNIVKSSVDGITWIDQLNPFFPDPDFFFDVSEWDNTTGAIAFNGSAWCIVASWRNFAGSQFRLASGITNDAGFTWNASRTITLPAAAYPIPPDNMPQRLAWFPERGEWFFANTIDSTGTGLFRSADGINWTAVPSPPFVGGIGWFRYDAPTASLMFCARGTGGPGAATGSAIVLLDSSLTFTQLPVDLSGTGGGIVWNTCRVGSMLMGTGAANRALNPGVVLTSTDNGSTWNEIAITSLQSICFGEIAGRALILQSVNGNLYDVYTPSGIVGSGVFPNDPGFGISGFTVKNGYAWASSGGGRIFRSDDMLTWTQTAASSVPSVASAFWGIA